MLQMMREMDHRSEVSIMTKKQKTDNFEEVKEIETDDVLEQGNLDMEPDGNEEEQKLDLDDEDDPDEEFDDGLEIDLEFDLDSDWDDEESETEEIQPSQSQSLKDFAEDWENRWAEWKWMDDH